MFNYVKLCSTMFNFVQLCFTLFNFVQLCSTLSNFIQLCSTLRSYAQILCLFHKVCMNNWHLPLGLKNEEIVPVEEVVWRISPSRSSGPLASSPLAPSTKLPHSDPTCNFSPVLTCKLGHEVVLFSDQCNSFTKCFPFGLMDLKWLSGGYLKLSNLITSYRVIFND